MDISYDSCTAAHVCDPVTGLPSLVSYVEGASIKGEVGEKQLGAYLARKLKGRSLVRLIVVDTVLDLEYLIGYMGVSCFLLPVWQEEILYDHSSSLDVSVP